MDHGDTAVVPRVVEGRLARARAGRRGRAALLVRPAARLDPGVAPPLWGAGISPGPGRA